MCSGQLENRAGFRTLRNNHGCSRLLVRMCSRLAYSGEHDRAARVTTPSSNSMLGERKKFHFEVRSERIARDIPIKNGSLSGIHHSLWNPDSVLKSHKDFSLGIPFFRATFVRLDLVVSSSLISSEIKKLRLLLRWSNTATTT